MKALKRDKGREEEISLRGHPGRKAQNRMIGYGVPKTGKRVARQIQTRRLQNRLAARIDFCDVYIDVWRGCQQKHFWP